MSAASAGYWQRLEAAQTQAFMTVSATVVDPAKANSIQQVQSVLVTAQDLARGFVDVPIGSRIDLKVPQRCVIELTASGGFFRSITVRGAAVTIRLEPHTGALRTPCRGTSGSFDLSYRFELEPGVGPGLYRWPISAAVLPL